MKLWISVQTENPRVVLLWQDAGVCAAVGEEDHLSQFVEKLDGSSRQLGQTPDGCSMNLLPRFNTHTKAHTVTL